MSAPVPNVLTIAGSDPSGGAGLQGDLKTFAAFHVHGCAVPTALTAQNSRGVHDVFPVPAHFVRRQLDVLFDDIEIRAVKIGMLANASVVTAVGEALERWKPAYVVLDPVLSATAGGALLDTTGLEAIRRELLPLVTLVTPNAAEAGMLLDRPAPKSPQNSARAARDLCAAGARAALVTGGHVNTGDQCIDVLYERASETAAEFRVARVNGASAHGTGCALSSAIAALLARGVSLAESCEQAQRFVAESIGATSELQVGTGAGPLNSLHHLWRCDAE
ncbi:MAG TPA: bifunctional hydroxymethylpyrimidine kinase/phosphomethylpyrimidine kinase [Gemmatimonadaceae bacterium]